MIILALYYSYYSICCYIDNGGPLLFWASSGRVGLQRIAANPQPDGRLII